MARKKTNKSQLIRDMLGLHPDKAPLEMVELIKTEHGITVPAGYISTIKSNVKRKGGKGKRKGRKTAAQSVNDGIKAAVNLVLAAGGVAEAKKVLETVEEIGRAVR